MAGGQPRGHSPPIRPYSGLGIAGDGLLGAGSGVGWSISVGAVVYVPRAYTDDSGTLCPPMRMPHRFFATTYLRHAFAMSLKRLG
jgi:hypothetical protein